MNNIDAITAFGHEINYARPEDTLVDPEDIRVHTQNICRYSGALKWELVRHLALCVALLPLYADEFAINTTEVQIQQAYAGSHDFHEIYVGDVVSGFKKYLPSYQVIEEAWEIYVHGRIGLAWDRKHSTLVRHVDVRALVCEMWQLGHPAAELVASQYGGPPTAAEKQIFETTRLLSLDECWNTTWRTVTRGRRLLKQQSHTFDII